MTFAGTAALGVIGIFVPSQNWYLIRKPIMNQQSQKMSYSLRLYSKMKLFLTLTVNDIHISLFKLNLILKINDKVLNGKVVNFMAILSLTLYKQ